MAYSTFSSSSSSSPIFGNSYYQDTPTRVRYNNNYNHNTSPIKARLNDNNYHSHYDNLPPFCLPSPPPSPPTGPLELEGWVPIIPPAPQPSFRSVLEEIEEKRRQEAAWAEWERQQSFYESSSSDLDSDSNNSNKSSQSHKLMTPESRRWNGNRNENEHENAYTPSDSNDDSSRRKPHLHPRPRPLPSCLVKRGYKGVYRIFDLDVDILLSIVAIVNFLLFTKACISAFTSHQKVVFSQRKGDLLFWLDRQYYFFDLRRAAVMWEVWEVLRLVRHCLYCALWYFVVGLVSVKLLLWSVFWVLEVRRQVVYPVSYEPTIRCVFTASS